jgi:hypothetical protein
MREPSEDKDAAGIFDYALDVLSKNGVEIAVSILKQKFSAPLAAIYAEQASSEGI